MLVAPCMTKTIAAALAALALASPAMATILGLAGAELKTADGRRVGGASIHVSGNQVRIAVNGLRPGRYGVHLHEVGRCQGPDFESAGPHWNPTTRQHGRLNPAGHHRGDLPNLEVGSDGTGRLVFTIEGPSIWDGPGRFLDADGTAVVVHAAPDDERTDPSGNSGDRIACGVLNY